MIKVALIGNGNVAYHLEKVLSTISIVDLIVLNSRTNFIEKLADIAICIIAVSDVAVAEVAKKLKGVDTLVVHTSGSVSIMELPNKRKGVFYPLQTFSKNKEINFSEIPICLEAEQKEDFILLETLANQISNTVIKVSSKQRRTLHLAAVFANNFTNHIFHITQEMCEANDLSFELMKPLIVETVDKIKTLNPIDAQTGPAKRKDFNTIATQKMLLSNSEYKDIYKQITQSILDTHGQKL